MKNAKVGFKKLFIAEILTAIGSLSMFLTERFWYFGIVLLIIDIVALFINRKGLKLIAKDQEGYKKAYDIVMLGLVFSVANLLLSFVIKSDSEFIVILKSIIKIFSDAIEFAVCYMVLNTSIKYLKDKGNDDLAKFANTTKNLLAFSYCVAVIVDFILATNIESWAILVIIVITFAAAIILIIAQIRYIIFLKKMIEIL